MCHLQSRDVYDSVREVIKTIGLIKNVNFNDKEFLLGLVLLAINKVDKHYYSKDEYAYVYEKGFCYEFYHQFRLLLCLISDDIILNGEPYKNLEIELISEYETLNIKKKNKSETYPDFVLHKGLNDMNSENQFMAIEVKRKNSIDNKKIVNEDRTSFENDIWKLNLFITNLGFKIGVFIAIDLDVKQIKEKLKKMEKIKEYITLENADRLYFISVKAMNESTPVIIKGLFNKEEINEEQVLPYFTAKQFLCPKTK